MEPQSTWISKMDPWRILGDEHEATTISQWNLLRTLIALEVPRESVLEFVSQLEWLFDASEEDLSHNQRVIRDMLRNLLEQLDAPDAE